MKYYLDTEFDGFNGPLISLALVREDGAYIYLVDDNVDIQDEWVIENVVPILFDIPGCYAAEIVESKHWGSRISDFLTGEDSVHVICDWPSDAVYFFQLLMTGPGTAVPMGQFTAVTVIRHVDIYPTTLEGAVQHNALWDALAIKEFCDGQ